MAQTKATKKFEKKHLKDTLKRRKDFAKIKQRHQLNDKRKARRQNERDGENAGEDDAGGDTSTGKKLASTTTDLGAMSVDDFFAESVTVPAKTKTKQKPIQRSGKRKQDDSDDDSSVASIEEHALMEGLEGPAADDLDNDESGAEDDFGTHKEDLKALAEKDPEFYKYLQENDAELLDFAEDADLGEIDELSGSEDESTANSSKKKKKKTLEVHSEQEPPRNELTPKIIKAWVVTMSEKHSLRTMRELVLAFRAAVHLNDENGKEYKYTISDAKVYHEVLLGALNHIPLVLSHHMPVKDLPNGKVRVNTESNKFKKMNNLVKSHTAAVLHLLESLTDAATIKMTLASLLALLPYTLSFKKVVKELVRAVVEVWAEAAHSEATRISAFLVLRRLVVIGDAGIKENVLKVVYQGLIKGSRATGVHSISGINLMKNSAAELWGLVDGNLSYTTAFTFIRQLAIHLRNSIKNNANDSYKTIYNWQYVHSLDFWSRVLALHCDPLREASLGYESTLRPIIYPLTQVTLGAMRLIPTAAYFPLRFQLVRALVRLSQATKTYIPLAAPLFEVLTSAEMKKAPKPSTLKPLDFDTNIRAAKSYLKTRIYQDGVGEQVVELLSEYFNLWNKSIAFPELALPVIVMLKRWLKEVNSFRASNGRQHGKPSKSEAGNKNAKLNSSVALFIQKLEANSRWIEEMRAKVDFAPNNRAGVEGFLKDTESSKTPLGAFVEGQRKQREVRKKTLEESRRKEDEARRKEKAGDVDTNGVDAFGSDSAVDEDEDSDVEIEVVGDDDSDADIVDGESGEDENDEDDEDSDGEEEELELED